MKTITSLSILALGAVAATAQTTAKAPVKHTPATTTAHTATTAAAKPVAPVGGCVKIFDISPKVPALPVSAGCPKALYTLTQHTMVSADYLSPLLGAKVRDELDFKPTSVTLAYTDVQAGTGALVEQGKFLKVKYTGWNTEGAKFDSSDDHPNKEPISLGYGQHSVIQGWDTGFEGMHVGGKRRLFIPYQLGYGDKSPSPLIPARANLVFDIEIVSQSDTPPAPPTPPTPPPAAKPAAPASEPAKPAATAEPKK